MACLLADPSVITNSQTLPPSRVSRDQESGERMKEVMRSPWQVVDVLGWTKKAKNIFATQDILKPVLFFWRLPAPKVAIFFS